MHCMLYVPECYAFCHVMPCVVDISTNSCFQLSSVASLHDRALLRVLCETPPRLRQRIERMSDEVYDVASSKQDGTVYTVNIATVMCTCFAGSTGKCCKHVHYVLTETQHLSQSVSYHFSDNRSLFYEVAIGSPAPSGWLDLLHGGLNQTRSASVEVPAPVDVPVPLEVPS